MKQLSTAFLAAAILITAAGPSNAEVKLPKLFSSHMVLQRDMPIHIWGESAPGEQVTVSLQDATAAATADSIGHWSIYLPARPAGGPYTLTVRGANTLQFGDILLGDLWLASGQSNMEMPLEGFNATTPIKDSAKEIAAANHPDIRLLHVEKDSSDYPLDDTKAVTGWSVCNPDTARKISAVGYFFSRSIAQKEHVAIGLIDSTWGGTPAEAWTSLDALSAAAALMPVFKVRAARMDQLAAGLRSQRLDAEAKATGKAVPSRPWVPDPASWRPAGLYNAMIAPFTPLPIRGVIWYQGEANAAPEMDYLYSHLFAALIQDWRAQWHQADLPFLFVQLASFDAGKNSWGPLREAQRATLRMVNTGMAVTIDVGEEHNIHPANKQVVADRLALLARSIAYKETNLVASGPLFRYAYPVGNTMHVTFDSAAGLTFKGAPPAVEVAAADGVFTPATITIEGETLIATCPTVTQPRYVRYAWVNFPSTDHPANLNNAAGLPSSPFSSYPAP
jgi:sialate O-acetylesterase